MMMNIRKMESVLMLNTTLPPSRVREGVLQPAAPPLVPAPPPAPLPRPPSGEVQAQADRQVPLLHPPGQDQDICEYSLEEASWHGAGRSLSNFGRCHGMGLEVFPTLGGVMAWGWESGRCLHLIPPECGWWMWLDDDPVFRQVG